MSMKSWLKSPAEFEYQLFVKDRTEILKRVVLGGTIVGLFIGAIGLFTMFPSFTGTCLGIGALLFVSHMIGATIRS